MRSLISHESTFDDLYIGLFVADEFKQLISLLFDLLFALNFSVDPTGFSESQSEFTENLISSKESVSLSIGMIGTDLASSLLHSSMLKSDK